MDAQPTTELVYQGICTLYHDNNPKEKEKASRWLEDFQKSVYSWTIADELLLQKRDLHSCYFAAQTMRNKIQNSFYELPQDSHESLRVSLLSHITQINNDTDPIIVTQLCLAVADLCLLMASWPSPISDLIDNFAQQPQLRWPVLEILTLVTEEMDSRYLRIGSNRRNDMQQQLIVTAPNVLAYLSQCLQCENAPSERILHAILRCFAAWLSVQAIKLEQIPKSPVSIEMFRLLTQTNTPRKLHEIAADCICTILGCLELNNNNDSSAFPALKLQIFEGVCMLEHAYHASVALEDIDKTINYCRIFTVAGECFIPDMIKSSDINPHYSLKAQDLLLTCVGHFDYEVAEITFHFWSKLSEELFHMDDDKLAEHFKPQVERLFLALYRHAQMNSDQDTLLDETDNFYEFRIKVSDLVKDVVFIPGSHPCFKQMFMLLQQPSNGWEAVEAALFIMSHIAKNIVPDEDEIVPQVMEAILNLNDQTHLAVRYTSILLLGELSEWIREHPMVLDATLSFLLSSLQQKNGLAPAAAVALTSICASSRVQMAQHIDGLAEIARNLNCFELNNELCIGLLKGISLILSQLPLKQIEPAMRQIMAYQLQPLALLIENEATVVPVPREERNEPKDPVYWIDRACAIVRHVNPDIDDEELHPTCNIIQEAWPLISRTMTKYQTDARVMERLCRLIRYAVRMLRRQAVMLVEPLVKQMVELYKLHNHSCFLYLGSVLVDEFARIEATVPGLLEMLQAFIQPTFLLLQSENGLVNNPETVDDFFRLTTRFLEGCPLQFLQSNLIAPIFQCALLACSLDHRDANSSVMKFFCNLLKYGRRNRAAECIVLVKNVAEAHGQALINNLIHAAVFSLPTYMLCDVADVLVELKAILPKGYMSEYLQHALELLPKNNSGGYVTATHLQLEEFCNTVMVADTPKEVSIALKCFTRLFR